MWQKYSHMWCWYTAQCEDGTIKCEKKKKGTTECYKSIVACDVGTVQREDGTIKYKKK